LGLPTNAMNPERKFALEGGISIHQIWQ